MRISDWSSDVCSSDLHLRAAASVADGDALAIELRKQSDRLRCAIKDHHRLAEHGAERKDVIGAVLARDAGLYQRNVDRVLGHHREVIGRAMRRIALQINTTARVALLVLLGKAL